MTRQDRHGTDDSRLRQAVYDGQSQQWTLHNGQSRFGPLTTLESNSEAYERAQEVGGHSKASVRAQAIHELLQDHPDLQPARQLISGLLVEDGTRLLEEEISLGSQLALAYVRAPRQRGKVGLEDFPLHNLILAFPGGSFGEQIRLQELRIDALGWDNDKSIWLEAAQLPARDAACWISESGPILQLESSKPSEFSSSVLAVRTAGLIHIVQLSYRVKHASISSLVAQTLVKLEMGYKGATSCMCLSLNPWNAEQIAAIDALGNWTAWNFAFHRDAMADVLVRCDVEKDDSKASGGFGAGWHQVLWTCDEYHVLTCSRKQLRLHELGAGPVAQWQLNDIDSSAVILDCKRSASSTEHVHVLTSSHILLLHVRRDEKPCQIDLVTSWFHHRSQMDGSLRLMSESLGDGKAVQGS